MEHRLLKQLNPTFTSNVLYGSLSSYPALDFINPGIGNVVQPYGLFVPIHSFHDPYKKTKEKPSETPAKIEQQGAGEISILETKKKEEEAKQERLVDQLNRKQKEKLADDAVYESFIHPRVIKTDTLHLKRPSSDSDKPTLKPTKLKKHSFHVVD